MVSVLALFSSAGSLAEWVTGTCCHSYSMAYAGSLPLLPVSSCVQMSRLCRSLDGVKLNRVLHEVSQQAGEAG